MSPSSSTLRIVALRPLLAFAAGMTRRDTAAAARAMARARRARAPRVAAEETALMLVLHVGYAAALEAVRVLARTWPGTPVPPPEAPRAAWRVRGRARCGEVYGDAYAKLIAQVRAMHPDLATWMIEEGYGRVLARPGLDPRARELVAVTVLAAGGWRRQLVSHLLGSIRLGATRPETRLAWRLGLERASTAVRAAGRAAWVDAFGGGGG